MAQPTMQHTKVQRERPALQKWVPALWAVVVQTGINDLQSTEMHYLQYTILLSRQQEQSLFFFFLQSFISKGRKLFLQTQLSSTPLILSDS